MTEQRNIFDRMLGLEEKRTFREFEVRAKALGADYYEDYVQLKDYIWLSGATRWKDFKFIFDQILDLLEECAVKKRQLTDLTGADVAAFIDQMIESRSWEDKQRRKLNKAVKK